MTDEHFAYRHLKEQGFFHHYMVEHGNNEYVRGKIHTQTIEGMWSILKRGIYGVYRVVSKKYLQAHIDELVGDITIENFIPPASTLM